MQKEIIGYAENIKKRNIPFRLDKNEFYSFIKRITNKKYADFIKVEQITSASGFDEYRIFDNDSGITIQATSGSCAAVALNRYLQDCCNYYIGILTQNGELPVNPPKIGKVIKNKSLFHYRYFLNYCTFGYTLAFYTWEDWQKLIDRILLSGYNLLLNPIGQECVWKQLLTELNYSEKDILNFLVAPNYMPWFLMMNFTNFESFYPSWWWNERIKLANKINKRLLKFGVGIILPGYSGMVPNDFKEHFPDCELIDQGTWSGFERPKYLMFNDKMFDVIAEKFYRIQNELIGDNQVHYYSSDPFHEGGIFHGINLKDYAEKVFSIMHKHDNKAVWVFQGWGDNPKRQMLNAIPAQNVLITNLLADSNGNAGDNYSDRPWLYCTVNNYGGQHLLRGSLKSSLEKPYDYIKKDDYTMLGVGLMPEAIENCEILFDIMADISVNENKTDSGDFLLKYIKLHYGSSSPNLFHAWKMLRDFIFIEDNIGSSFESPFIACPSLCVDRVVNCGKHAEDRYPVELLEISELFLKEYDCCKNSQSYLFDFIDIVRQLSANFSWHFVYLIQDSFMKKDLSAFESYSDIFSDMLFLQEKLLLSNNMFLYQNLKEKAYKSGKTKHDKEYFDYLTKLIITVWGDERTWNQPDANHRLEGILDNYAGREYGDLIRDFYRPRWQKYLNMLKLSLIGNSDYKEYNFNLYNKMFCYKDIKKEYKKYDTKKIIVEIIEKIKALAW